MSWKEAAVGALAHILGTGFSSRAAAAVLSRALRLAAPRRAVAERNLRRALPEATDAEIAARLRETYEHLVWTGIEFIVLQRDPSAVLGWFEAENASELDALEGRGAILISGHIGNWELTAAWIAQRGHKITAIVREAEDAGERGLIERMRERAGIACLPKDAPMTRSISVLRRGEFLAILADQHAGSEGIPAPFFGITTGTAKGPAVFAVLTKKPLIPIYTHRIAPFRHRVRIGGPIDWDRGAARDDAIFEITKRMNGAFEEMVLDAPGQWLAQHRRFRELETG